jgi:alkylhydroperoxidase/carboxymuconolactone decarboxylase family protein YurZ
MVDVKADALFVNDIFAAPDWLVATYPEFVSTRQRMAKTVFAPDGALPLRIKEITAVCVLAYRHDPTVGTHMRRAIAAGATLREIVEGLMVVTAPGGAPCLNYALNDIKTLIAELGEEEASRRPAPGNEAKARTGREFTFGVWQWIEDNYPEWQESRRQANQLMHMPEDATLAPKYREIVTAVVLSCRAYPTLGQHLRRAIREGATLEEMIEAMQIGAQIAGAPVFHHAIPYFRELQGEIESGSLAPAPETGAGA